MDSLGFPHRHQVSNHGNTSSTSGLHPGEAGATAIFSTQGLDLQDYAAALAHNINMSGLTTDFQVEGIKQDVSAVHGSSSRNSVNSGSQVGVPAINQNDMNSLFFVGQQQQNTVPHNIAFPQALNSSVHSVNVGGIQLQMGSLPALDATVLNKMELQTSPATSLHLTASVPASSSVAAATSASLPSISMVSFAPSQPHPPLLAVSKMSSLQNEMMMQSLRIPTSTIQPQMSMSPAVTGLTHISTATAGPGQHHQVSFQNTVSEQLKVEQSDAKKAVNQIAMTSLASASSSSLLPSSSSSSASALLTQNVSDRVPPPPVDQPPLVEPRIPVQTSISIPIEGSSECLQDVQLLVVPDRQNPGRIFLTGVASAGDNLLSVINQTQLCIDERSERNFVPIFLNENVNGCKEKSQQLDTNSSSVKKGKGSKKTVLSAKMDKQKQKVESITVNRVNDNTTTVRVILTSGIAGGVRKSKVRRFPAKNAKQTNHSSAVEEEINFSFENKVTSAIKSGSEALSKETHAAENGGSQTISHRSSAVDDRNEEGSSVNKSNISVSQQSEKQVGDQDRRDTNDNNEDESDDDDDDDNDDDDESDKSENSSHKDADKTRDECGQKSSSLDPNLDELMHPILSSELAVESTQRTEINIQIDDSQCVVENGQKRWTCHLCPKNYTTKHNLITHILDHNGIKPHCCIICGRFFKQLSHLNTHMLTHNNVKPHACTVCGRAFTQISHVKRHMATHMSEKPHVCELCGRGFAYPSEMRTHMEKHKKTQGLCCELCDNAFASAKLLKQHMETHKDHEGLTCAHCKRIFQYPSQLKDHMVKHSGKRPCICTECGMDFMKVTQPILNLMILYIYS